MTLEINPISLKGKWRRGVALHLQTLSSIPLGPNQSGHMQYDTQRPEIAERLLELKYKGKASSAGPIIDTAVEFLRPRANKFDIIVPVPPSKHRQLQPVIVLAEGIANRLNRPCLNCVTTTRDTAQLKNIDDPNERQQHMNGLFAVDIAQTRNKRILLFDDLYRSGTTLNAITDLLLTTGKAADVVVLTITKTRVNQ